MKKFLIIFLILLLAGCSSQEALYNKTVVTNTLEDYEKYLEKYPEGEYSNKIKLLIQE